MSGRGTDFFISHAGRDTAWAEWLAWQLQQAGWTVEVGVCDWAPGEDFVARMQQALQRADRLLAVRTEAYFASAFGGVTSLRLPPVRLTASGMPPASQIGWCLEPGRPRSTGEGPT